MDILYHPKLAIAVQNNILGLNANPLGLFKYEDIIKIRYLIFLSCEKGCLKIDLILRQLLVLLY